MPRKSALPDSSSSKPKPKEPTKHQYDSDAAACINYLRAYDLLDSFKLNIETNHATLAGHTMMPRTGVCRHARRLWGSIDANTGDLLLGWSTISFPQITTDHPVHARHLEIWRAGSWWCELLMPRCGVRASSRSICSTRTSAVWMRSRKASKSRPRSAPTANSNRCSIDRYASWIAVLERKSNGVPPTSKSSNNTCWPRGHHAQQEWSPGNAREPDQPLPVVCLTVDITMPCSGTGRRAFILDPGYPYQRGGSAPRARLSPCPSRPRRRKGDCGRDKRRESGHHVS